MVWMIFLFFCRKRGWCTDRCRETKTLRYVWWQSRQRYNATLPYKSWVWARLSGCWHGFRIWFHRRRAVQYVFWKWFSTNANHPQTVCITTWICGRLTILNHFEAKFCEFPSLSISATSLLSTPSNVNSATKSCFRSDSCASVDFDASIIFYTRANI